MKQIKDISELKNKDYYFRKVRINNPTKVNLVVKNNLNREPQEIIKEFIGNQLEVISKDVLSEISGHTHYFVENLNYKLFPARDELTGVELNGQKIAIYSAKLEVYRIN